LNAATLSGRGDQGFASESRLCHQALCIFDVQINFVQFALLTQPHQLLRIRQGQQQVGFV